MKKIRFMSKAFALSALGLAAGAGVASCSKNIDSLFFTVKGQNLEVTFCDRGASIYSIKYKDKVVTYHPQDKNTFIRNDYYYGKTLGRIAGRIKDGRLSVGGKDYQLEVNETTGKKNNSLHGGTNGFCSKDWSHTIEETNDAYNVSFTYVSPAMEAGYPEEVNSLFVYTIYKAQDKIDLNITASVSGTTPLNLSTHPFFRLAEDGDILNHKLQINAHQMAQYDNVAQDQTVLYAKEIGEADYPFDFYEAKPIGQDIQAAKELDPVSGGYDHIWKFDNNTSKDERFVKLTNPANHYSLKVSSDADAVILYANDYPHADQPMNPSGVDTLYSGITIEPIKFFTKDTVDTLNISPDELFTRSITYEFSDAE